MKKSLFIVALAATALTGCRKDDSFVNNTPNEQEGELIALHLGSPVSVTTRSTGAVGDLAESSANVWNGQELNVFMLATNYIDPATETYNIESTDKYGTVTESDGVKNNPLFWNTKVYAPVGGPAGLATYGENYQKKYYPTVGTFDFFAYHDDDAAENYGQGTAQLTAPEEVKEEETGKVITTGDITVGVLIDGSQDLMVAKAALTEDQKASEKFAGKEQEERDGKMTNTYYSAYAARRGVQPTFKFEHLLSRFVFNVTPGKESAAGDTGIVINKIYVKNVKNEAQMIVASTKDIYTYDQTGKFNASAFLAWAKESDAADAKFKTSEKMFLQQRNEEGSIEELEPTYLEWVAQDGDVEAHGKKTKIGESLLLPADTTKYELVIEYSERPNLDANNNGEYAAAYAAAKQEAFDAAYAEAYAAAEATAKYIDSIAALKEAYVDAYKEAYKGAKEIAYNQNNKSVITSLENWRWVENGDTVVVEYPPYVTEQTKENYALWDWDEILKVVDGDETTYWIWSLDKILVQTQEEGDWTWAESEWKSWSANWTWTAGADWKWYEGREYDEDGTVTVEGTEITVANWVWDGEAEWEAGFKAYQNRVYKNTVTAILELDKLANDNPDKLRFEAGMQYNVNFTVYSLEEITLTMQLTGWENGGDLNFDNDSPFEPIEVTYGGVELGGNTTPVTPGN